MVAKREYLKNVKKPAFWLSVFALPALVTVLMVIQYYSNESAMKKAEQEVSEAKAILLLDRSGVINPMLYQPPFEAVSDKEAALARVKEAEADVLIIYPENLKESGKVEVYVPDGSLMGRDKYNGVAQEMVRQSLLLTIEDQEAARLLSQGLKVETFIFEDGETAAAGFEDYLVPLLSVIIYFMMVFIGSNFLLMSMSEEKENRMMEIVLSILSPGELISGKIFGLVGLILTQLAIFAVLGYAGFQYALPRLPFELDLSAVVIDPVILGLNLFYAFAGFFLIATIMVGAGAVMPSYKDAQGFTSVFIMLSIFPIYFAALIVQDPSGPVAMALSYFPFSAPLVFLARNALDSLPLWEKLLSIPLLVAYVALGFYLAFKLFELGALEYQKKLSVKGLLAGFKRN